MARSSFNIRTWKEFERAIGKLLHLAFPSSVHKSLSLAIPNSPECEIDNIIHIRLGGVDYIVEIEVKHQDIYIDAANQWMATYSKPEDVKKQISKHIKALRALYHLDRDDIDLRFVVFVCSAGVESAPATDYEGAELHLTPFPDLLHRIGERFQLNSTGKCVCITESNAFFSFQPRSETAANPLVVRTRLSVSDLARRVYRDRRTVLNTMQRLGIESPPDGLLSEHEMERVALEFDFQLSVQDGAPDTVLLKEPITARSLAQAMKLKEWQVNGILIKMSIFPEPGLLIMLDDAIECCYRLGYYGARV